MKRFQGMSSTVVKMLLAVVSFVVASVDGETYCTEPFGYVRVSLTEGQNYIAPPLLGTNSTIHTLFGDSLPAGGVEGAATLVEEWSNTSQMLGERYWHSSAEGFEGWRTNGFHEADTSVIARAAGYRVTIREGEGSVDFIFLGRVPTNETVQFVHRDGYSLVQTAFPVPIALGSSGLTDSGFTGSGNLVFSDWILFFNPATGLFDEMTWYDSVAGRWRNPNGSVATRELQPGEALLIWRKDRTTDMLWTNRAPYTLP